MDYLPRELTPRIEAALRTMPVVVVTGMRQVGKTTLIRNAPGLRERAYLNVDEFSIETAARTDPVGLLEGYDRVTVDEVQRSPDLLRAIKILVDRDRRPGQFLLSGSANLALLAQVCESLAGRAVYLELEPMSARELDRRTSTTPFVLQVLERGSVPRDAGVPSQPVDARVLTGGMPPVAAGGADFDTWMRGFEQTYLERDVRDLARVGDLAVFRNLVRLVALRTGRLSNVSELARDAALSVPTVTRYLGVLEASFFLSRLPPYLRNPVARLVKSPKHYIRDAGLARFLAESTAGAASPEHPTDGFLLETWVAQNLRALLAAWAPEAALSFWSVQSRHEVDLVVEHRGRQIAIEVKRAARWNDRDLAGLRAFAQKNPTCVAGLLACHVDQVVPLGERLFAVPLARIVG